MTTKIEGTLGVQFPDASVQGSAAFTKAETNSRTWQNVTAVRLPSTNYVNDSGGEIEVSVQLTTDLNTNSDLSMSCGSAPSLVPTYFFIGPTPSAQAITGVLTVPAGETYKVDITGCVIGSWFELRKP